MKREYVDDEMKGVDVMKMDMRLSKTSFFQAVIRLAAYQRKMFFCRR